MSPWYRSSLTRRVLLISNRATAMANALGGDSSAGAASV